MTGVGRQGKRLPGRFEKRGTLMATYATLYLAQYTNGALVGNAAFARTLTDMDDSSNTFTVGESIRAVNESNGSAFFGTFSGTTMIDGNLFLVLTSGTVVIVFGPVTPSSAFPDNLSSLTITPDNFTVCFLAGTRIATPEGETPVETLAIGDLVLTADGRSAPVRWVGVQTVVSIFTEPLRSFPIRITAGALGAGLPQRDLLVSPDHALMLDGVLVQAGALVNGTTIVRETAMPDRFTYYHVELDDHSLILAEGVPAESFLDTVTRRRFDNFAAYEARYGDGGPVLAEFPAPRIKSARQLPQALRQRLAARADGRGGIAGTVAAA